MNLWETRPMIIRNVGVLSVGKVFGCVYALLGLIIGGIFSLISLAGFAAAGGGQNAGPGALIFGVGAIVAVPIFYGVIGFIGGIITAALYNLVAALVGGVELDLIQRDRLELTPRAEF
jgi:hypothetical protein